MNVWIRKCMLLTIAVTSVAAAQAGKTFALNEDGLKLRLGADVRLRLTRIDSNALPISGTVIDAADMDDLEYLRLRTRVWAGLEFSDSLSLHARLVNRSQYFTSRHVSPDNDYNEPSPTWAFWDETVLDNLYLNVRSPFGAEPWTLRLGRQDIVLGNGMVFLEGTPYDQGRSIYFDGIRADYLCNKTTLTLLALHNKFKDYRGAILGDEGRRLRRGETAVLGAYWTQSIRDGLGTDLYGFYIDIDDDQPGSAARQPNHPADENATIKILGGRVFGQANADTEYSLEVAHQFGTFNGSGNKEDLKGWMADARLGLRQLADRQFAPVFSLQYTYMSGADNDADGDYEGWHPAFAEYPVWREELMAVKTYGNWTNLHQARLTTDLTLNEKTTLQISGATIYADETTPPLVNGVVPDGDHVGELLSAFLDYRFNPAMTLSLQASQLYPGDHLPDINTTEWLRFQAIYRF